MYWYFELEGQIQLCVHVWYQSFMVLKISWLVGISED